MRRSRLTAPVVAIASLPIAVIVLLLGCDDPTRPRPSGAGATPQLDAVEVMATSRGTVGEWSPVMRWPVIAIHAHLLPNGRVLTWGGENNWNGSAGGQRLVFWDPATPTTFSEIYAAGTDIFCSGHAFLPDGRLLVTGGHQGDALGVANANTYNYVTGAWSPTGRMNAGRWYPTTTTLGNGTALVIGGTDERGDNNTLPQVWQANGSWRSLTTAQRTLDWYPWMHVAPNGKVFNSGPQQTASYLSTSGTGAWTTVAASNFGHRSYGSSVMYSPGKVLIVGGGDPPTNTAEIIDLRATPPAWRYTGAMTFRRRQLNATLLADGKVLVTGGTSGSGFNNESSPVLAAELWNPATGTWSRLSSMQRPRMYHFTTLLLPDGRVLSAGGGRCAGCQINNLDAEIFSPPYLFNADGTPAVRPAISDAPATVAYGQTFFVGTPDVAGITRVTWIRLGSVTHAFDQNQRFFTTSFSKVAGGLSVSSPASRSNAPPGHYMLFILKGRVPSVARIIRVS